VRVLHVLKHKQIQLTKKLFRHNYLLVINRHTIDKSRKNSMLSVSSVNAIVLRIRDCI